MREKFVNFFKRDSTLKALSVISAIIIWFFVLSDGNPKVDRTMVVSYKIDKESVMGNAEDVSIKNIDDINVTINVKISGRSKSVNNTTENDIKVKLDYSGVNKDGELKIPVMVETNKVGIKIDSYSPKEVSVRFEKIIDKSFNVKVDVDPNVYKKGYELHETKVVPESIPIRGFESLVSRVSYVKVYIVPSDVGQPIETSKTVRKICKYYDKNGKEITDFDKNEFVDINITVGKKISLTHSIEGRPHKDYYIEGSSITPTNILITGDPSVIKDITSLTVQPVDVSNAQADVRKRVNIILPEGVELLNTGLQPEVTVNIEKYDKKTITVKNTDIILQGVDNNKYDYIITEGSYTYEFIGKKGELTNITLSSLKPQINLKDLTEGNYKRSINITVPKGIQVKGSHAANVIISSKPETPTPPYVTETPVSTEPTPSPTEAGGTTTMPSNTATPDEIE